MTKNTLKQATFTRFYEEPSQENSANGSRTWLTRGANFVVAYTEACDGERLDREDNPDEYMVFTPLVSATISVGGQQSLAAPDSLTIVPPGASSIVVHGNGALVRVFSNRALDLADAASNRDYYRDGAPGVAPLDPWPEPEGGFRLRNYPLARYLRPGSNLRVFRSTNLMVNMLVKREVPRDTRTLSPHSHQDFEQGSLAIGGTYIHHCRYPWTPDMSTWLDDEHVEVGSPSLMVVPPKCIHTSRNIGKQAGWLVDIFAPPRFDFSLRPGVVCNADEYPMPTISAEAAANVAANKE